ncbi:MAG: PAS domain S-box protein [Ignavibacteriales bacterium]|nr:PAS domain S-box protein [Ignavibacteriales bacterium]
MKKQLQEFSQFVFRSPDNPEPDQARLVALLRNSIWAIVLSGGINFIGSLVLSSNITRYALILAGCVMIALAAHLLLGRVGLRVAAISMLGSGWLMTTALCLTGGGLRSPVFLLFAVLSLAAAVLLGRKALFVSVAATILVAFGLASLEANGLLPQSSSTITPYSLFFNYTALLVLIWYLQLFITGSLTKALGDSQIEVSSRREAEERAIMSRLLLRSVLDSTQDLIVAVDNEMNVMAFNKPVFERVQKLNKITPFVGMPLEDMLPEHRRRVVLEAGGRVLKGEQVTLESSSPTANGGTAINEEVYTPIRTVDGTIEGFTIFVRTITDRKASEKRLQEAQSMLAQVLDTIPQSVFWKDRDGTFLGCNKAFARDTRFHTPGAVIGRNDYDLTPSHDIAEAYCADDRGVIESGRPKHHIVHRSNNVDRPGRWIDTTKIPLVAEDGSIFGVLGVFEDVTERKQSEEALQQERNLLRTLIDSLPDSVFIYIKDCSSRYVINNLAHIRSLGATSQDEVIGKRSFDYFTGDQASRFFEDEQEVIRSGEPLIDREEITYDKELAEPRWHLTTKVPLRDSAGNVVGLVGMSSDITERKRAEEALKESEARFRSLYDNSTVGLYRTTPDGRVLMSNPAVVEMLGYDSFDQLMQKNIEQQDFDPDYPRSEFREKLERDGTIKGLESAWRRRDGTVIFVRESATVVRDEGGRALYYDGVVEDITERKRAEEALSEERERLAVTLRSIGDGVITTDLQGNILLMNRVAELLTGWPLDEAVGRPLSEVFRIIDEHTRENRKNPVEEVLETRRVIELANHTVLVNRSGDEIVVADSGAPIFDKQSNIIGVVLVFRDTTEKQRLLANMQRADKLQSLGVLAGGLAHDFNNLLGGIFGYLELAQNHSGPNEKAKRYIEKAMTTFNRAKDLTQQLLTFSKGGAPNRKTGSIAPVLRENTLFALSGSSVSPAFALESDLWLCDFDENQIGQVIDNLVINAQQAMPLGGSITISAQNVRLTSESSVPLDAGNYVRFSVTDSGTGIPPNILPRIFDPFFTTKQKGSGLGLTTVYSIVEKHNGTITVDSKQDKGTTFHVYLPASELTIVEEAPQVVTKHIGKGRILVMDDEESIRETTQDMLESLGYEVVCAQEGQEAIDCYHSASTEGRAFDAVIMDLTVPGGIGGKEGIRKLREQYPNVIAFVSSGYSNDPVLANPTEYGFTDKIQKPFRLDELSRLLHRHFSTEKS